MTKEEDLRETLVVVKPIDETKSRGGEPPYLPHALHPQIHYH
jgi:hypothetical protein